MGVDVEEGRDLTSRWGRQRGWRSHEWVWTSKGVGGLTVGVDVKGGGGLTSECGHLEKTHGHTSKMSEKCCHGSQGPFQPSKGD